MLQNWLAYESNKHPEFGSYDYKFPLQRLPLDVKEMIAKTLANTNSFKETMLTLAPLLQVNKDWNSVLNSHSMHNSIAKRHHITPNTAKLYLATNPDSKQEALSQIVANKHELFKAAQDSLYIDLELNSPKSRTIKNALIKEIALAKEEYRDKWQNPLGVLNPISNKCNLNWIYSDNSFISAATYYQGHRNMPYVIAKIKPDGTTDQSFGRRYHFSNHGLQITNPNASPSGVIEISGMPKMVIETPVMAAQDNKIIISCIRKPNHGQGLRRLHLARFNSNGTLDSTFGNNGIVDTTVTYTGQNLINAANTPEGRIVDVLTINPQTKDIVFRANGQVKKYTADGIEIQ